MDKNSSQLNSIQFPLLYQQKLVFSKIFIVNIIEFIANCNYMIGETTFDFIYINIYAALQTANVAQLSDFQILEKKKN